MPRHFFILLFITHSVIASSDIDCSDPKNVRSCTKIDYSQTELNYQQFIGNMRNKLAEKVNPGYADSFLSVENHWEKLVKMQCEHVREFYQSGTLGASSFISCYNTLYQNRINDLKIIYDDVIGDR